MRQRETLQEQLDRQIRKHLKLGNLLAVRYYRERYDCSACASWERFRGSAMGIEWIKRQII